MEVSIWTLRRCGYLHPQLYTGEVNDTCYQERLRTYGAQPPLPGMPLAYALEREGAGLITVYAWFDNGLAHACCAYANRNRLGGSRTSITPLFA